MKKNKIIKLLIYILSVMAIHGINDDSNNELVGLLESIDRELLIAAIVNEKENITHTKRKDYDDSEVIQYDTSEISPVNKKAKKTLMCKDCGKICNSQSHLDQHIKAIHENNFVCHICDKKCSSPWRLDTHIKGEHEGNFLCLVCGKRLSSQPSLNRHILGQHTLGFICQECGQNYGEKFALNRHIKEVHGKDFFICQHCCKGYKALSTLNRHIKLKHS